MPGPVRCTRAKVTAAGGVGLGNRYATSVGTQWAHTVVDVVRDNLDVVIIHNHHIIKTLRIDPQRRYQPSRGQTRPAPLRVRHVLTHLSAMSRHMTDPSAVSVASIHAAT